MVLSATHTLRNLCAFSVSTSRKKSRNLARVLGQHGPGARSLGGAGSRGEWKGVQSLPQLSQQMPDVTVFGEMRTGAMVCGCRDQLIYRITPLELWIKPLAELAWFTRWWVDLVWNAGSMQIHRLSS